MKGNLDIKDDKDDKDDKNDKKSNIINLANGTDDGDAENLAQLKSYTDSDQGCLPFTKTIRLEISGINITQLIPTLRERESL